MAVLSATALPARPEQRKAAPRIAGRQQQPLAEVPEHEGVITLQLRQAVNALLAVRGQDVLGVAGGRLGAVFAREPTAQFIEIVEPSQKEDAAVLVDGLGEQFRSARPALPQLGGK